MLSLIPPILTAFVQLALPVAAGSLLSVIVRGNREVFRAIGTVVVWITLPLYFFLNVSQVDLAAIGNALIFPVGAFIHIGVALMVARLLVHAVGRQLAHADRRAAMALGGFGNGGYLPIAMSELAPVAIPALAPLLPEGLPAFYVGIYMLAMSPLLWSVGNWLVTGSGERLRIRTFFPPPVLGILAGLVASALGLEAPPESGGSLWFHVGSALERIAAMTVPLALMTLGGLIAAIRPEAALDRRSRRIVGVAVTVRLLVMPALFWLAVTMARDVAAAIPIPVIWVLFLEFHTPPATNLSVMVTRAGTNQHATGFALSISYLLAILFYPFYLLLFLRFVGI